MRWFGRKGGAAARPALVRAMAGLATGPVSGWGSAGGPADGGPRSYEVQVREAYLANPVAQRAVRLVAEGVAGVPVYAVPDGHPAAALLGASGTGRALIETIAAQLLLHGNAYVQIVCDAGGAPVELYPLRPERVSVEPDAQGWPAAWLYRAGERTTRLPVTDGLGKPALVHLRGYHPLDDHYGLGCLGAAYGSVAIHNAARPSGALVYDPGEPGAALSGDQFDRLKAEMEASFSGSANAGRPMLLEGGLKWQAIGLTPADMDFVGLKAAAAREIALAFGVPPMLMGLPGDNSYANYSEANRALWRLGIVPLAEKIVGGITPALRAWWPELELKLDLDAIPALASDRERLWSMAAGADFLSEDEKREMLGFPPGGEGR